MTFGFSDVDRAHEEGLNQVDQGFNSRALEDTTADHSLRRPLHYMSGKHVQSRQ
jgi:hypothetical protein